MFARRKFFFLTAIVIFLLSSREVFAQVVINEFSALSSPDWVEIYNLGGEIVDLNGWEIRDNSATNKINLWGLICPQSFRKFDFSNRLNNGGDEIRLINSIGEEKDWIGYFSQAIPVHVITESTSRSPDGGSNWVVFTWPTPGDDDCVSPTLVPTITLIITPTPTLTPTIIPTTIPEEKTDYENIFLNEVMINPKEGQEWVEIYNANNQAVFLENWFLDDIAGGGSQPQKFSLTIGAYGYGVVNFNRAVFNNTGDEVRLLNSQEEEKDRFGYTKSVVGQSWGQSGDDWCLQEQSEGDPNLDCLINSTPTIVPTSVPTSASTSVPVPTSFIADVLGQTDRQTDFADFNLKTYLSLSDQQKPPSLLAVKTSYQPNNNWPPEWLLFSWGGGSFILGLIRILRKRKISFR